MYVEILIKTKLYEVACSKTEWERWWGRNIFNNFIISHSTTVGQLRFFRTTSKVHWKKKFLLKSPFNFHILTLSVASHRHSDVHRNIKIKYLNSMKHEILYIITRASDIKIKIISIELIFDSYGKQWTNASQDIIKQHFWVSIERKKERKRQNQWCEVLEKFNTCVDGFIVILQLSYTYLLLKIPSSLSTTFWVPRIPSFHSVRFDIKFQI